MAFYSPYSLPPTSFLPAQAPLSIAQPVVTVSTLAPFGAPTVHPVTAGVFTTTLRPPISAVPPPTPATLPLPPTTLRLGGHIVSVPASTVPLPTHPTSAPVFDNGVVHAAGASVKTGFIAHGFGSQSPAS
eukprot:EG_transcript_46864